MSRTGGTAILAIVSIVVLGTFATDRYMLHAEPEHEISEDVKKVAYTGTTSCRKCHEKFYKLWAPSHHGLAMQPYTAELAQSKLTQQKDDIVIGKRSYRAEISGDEGFVLENGPEGKKKYPMLHVMGGKTVYYFGGRLRFPPTNDCCGGGPGDYEDHGGGDGGRTYSIAPCYPRKV